MGDGLDSKSKELIRFQDCLISSPICRKTLPSVGAHTLISARFSSPNASSSSRNKAAYCCTYFVGSS